MKRHLLYILVAVAALAGCKGSLPENETLLLSSISDTLFFSSSEKGPYQVFAKKANGFTQIIADETLDYWGLRISPDKKKFICYRSGIDNFFRENDYDNAELWMYNIDGTGGKILIAKGQNAWRAQGYASWHPDGKHIVMAAEVKDPADDNNYRWHLFVADTLGTTPIKLTAHVGLFTDPAVNVVGNKLAYMAFPQNITSGSIFKQELFVADLDTNSWTISNQDQLTTDVWWDHNPKWSPDGNSIVFSTATNPTNLSQDINLRLYSFVGSSATVLRGDGAVYQQASWSANGTYMYIQYRLNGQKPYAIARINADGSGFIPVLLNEASDLINPQVY